MFEVQPLSQKEYLQLSSLGLNAVMVYQETYNSRHHLRGKKADIEWRLNTPIDWGPPALIKSV